MPYHKSNTSRRSGISYGNNNRRNFSHGRRPSGRKGPKKDYIDPRRFVKIAKPRAEVLYQPTHTFSDFVIDPLIQKNIEVKGFVNPSAIQDQSIQHVLDGRDVIGIADTGSGKTAAFGIPMLHALMGGTTKLLVVVPTRELAQQIDVEFRNLAKGSGLFAAVIIGGASMGPQLRNLRENPEIVIGTPGRIQDHVRRGSLQLESFNAVVLDEVDRMLDMGFVNDVREILSELSTERQSLFFSATLDERVRGLINTFANDPVTVAVKTGDTGENIHQDVVRVRDEDKINRLHDMLIGGTMNKVIIFDDTQRSVEKLSNELVARGFTADALHGGKTQGQRQRSLNKFRRNEVNILVATDVAARGIDIADVTHVINYSTPQSYADYVHRIGRAGRAGKVGYAFTFIPENY